MRCRLTTDFRKWIKYPKFDRAVLLIESKEKWVRYPAAIGKTKLTRKELIAKWAPLVYLLNK